jgi:hypothetical protein
VKAPLTAAFSLPLRVIEMLYQGAYVPLEINIPSGRGGESHLIVSLSIMVAFMTYVLLKMHFDFPNPISKKFLPSIVIWV